MKTYPEAITKSNKFGRYPLHVYFDPYYYYYYYNNNNNNNNDNSESVLNLLIGLYPDAIKKVDHFGKYPLHYAAYRIESESVIESLIVTIPGCGSESRP